MKLMLLSLTLAALFCGGCTKEKPAASKPESLTEQYDESEMERAISTARERMDEFLKVLEAKDADSFSVKAPITDENGTEYFWITDVAHADGVFSGLVGNDPGIVRNVKMGQPWKVAEAEISDWIYMRGEKIHGGFTIDPLLESYPEEEADQLRSKLVR